MHPAPFEVMTQQTLAARRLEQMHDAAERALSGGPVPLEELVPPDADAALLLGVASAAQRLRMCLAGLKDAEALLADVEANPHPAETPERWERAHREVCRLRKEMLAAMAEAYELRAELEIRARRERQ